MGCPLIKPCVLSGISIRSLIILVTASRALSPSLSIDCLPCRAGKPIRQPESAEAVSLQGSLAVCHTLSRCVSGCVGSLLEPGEVRGVGLSWEVPAPWQHSSPGSFSVQDEQRGTISLHPVTECCLGRAPSKPSSGRDSVVIVRVLKG